MYSNVRSNSFLLSSRLLPISHMSRFTTCWRTVNISAPNVSTAAMRAATLMVGHGPRPWSQPGLPHSTPPWPHSRPSRSPDRYWAAGAFHQPGAGRWANSPQLDRAISRNDRLLHRFRYGTFVVRREDDLQFVSAVCCMHLKSKNAESLVMAHVEVCQPNKREIRDDSSKMMEVSRVLAR